MGSITLNSNIASLKAQRRVGEASANLSTTFTRLSSGLRINKASDDAAGLAIASSLEIDQRVFNQGVRNLNDGVSLLSIADSALEELSGITTRLAELAEQSANGSLSDTQRGALDEEAQALKDEFFRIGKTTKFNGQNLFDAEFGELRLQSGFGFDGGISSELGGAVATGEFAEVATVAKASQTDIALGDINNDGILDLVTSDATTITTYIGQGGGSFLESQSIASTTRELALGDINNDGLLDIVGIAGGTSSFLGAGDGTFTFADSNVNTSNGDVALADLNDDGFLDVVMTGNNTVTQLGAGDGSFVTEDSVSDAGGNTTYKLDVGDINGDGILDIVTAGTDTGDAFVGRYIGTGDGGFTDIGRVTPTGDYAYDVTLGDFNGDGALDFVSVGESGAQVRINDGTGNFSSLGSFSAGVGTILGVEAGDIDGDGVLDLAFIGTAGGGTTTFSLGQGDGTFVYESGVSTSGTGSSEIILGDATGDGVLDAVTLGTTHTAVLAAETTSGLNPLLDFDLGTLAGARQALPIFLQKLDQLAEHRGQIGAFESRVSSAINTTRVAAENFAIARSQIIDADIALEAANLVRQSVLQDAGVAVLAQANQSSALALLLLG